MIGILRGVGQLSRFSLVYCILLALGLPFSYLIGHKNNSRSYETALGYVYLSNQKGLRGFLLGEIITLLLLNLYLIDLFANLDWRVLSDRINE